MGAPVAKNERPRRCIRPSFLRVNCPNHSTLMLDNVSIAVIDLDRVERLYDAVIAALDVPKAGRGDGSLGCGLCHCGRDLDGGVGEPWLGWVSNRPSAALPPEYYAAFLLDPCGNRVEAVCRRREQA